MSNIRCAWAKDPLGIDYHDKVFGRPIYEDRALFERLVLEGMQAGLSWLTILKRKEGMTKAYLKIQEERGSFSDYIWSFAGYKVMDNECHAIDDIPVETEISKAMSKDLKRRGF